MSPTPRVGLSLMPTEDARLANTALFDAGLVDAIEWSVDFGYLGAPPWVDALLDTYSARGALYAHGVELSMMSARFTPNHEAWLEHLATALRARRYQHLTEHYGFMTAGDFARGTPLPLPPSRALLALAIDRVRRLAELAEVPVGIENLAFALGRDCALAQADFVAELCEKTGAFLLFDVHNLLCQADNFDLDPVALARSYPLARAKQIHFAGGTLTPPRTPRGTLFRRDGHDAPAPDAELELLAAVLPSCVALDVVILERSDRSLFTAAEVDTHHAEFKRLREIVGAATISRAPHPRVSVAHSLPWIDDSVAELDAYQVTLLETLASLDDPRAARAALAAAPAPYQPYLERVEPHALEVALALVRQWSARSEPDPEIAGPTMHAAVFTKPELPLELRNLPVPSPGPGQVLLRVAAVGLCGTDAHAYRGQFPVPLPIVLGHETVGVVEAVGVGVAHPRVGDRVGVSWVQRGCSRCRACVAGLVERCTAPRTWIENGGGLSDLAIVEATGLTVLPDGLDFELAAPVFCGGHVVASGLRRASPRPGERVCVLGVGGLGHLAIGVAAAQGLEVVALTSSQEKARDARALGASEAFVFDRPEDAGPTLERAGGAAIALSTTSSMRAAESLLRGLDVGGRAVLLGLGDGGVTLDPLDVVAREISIIGAVQGPREELVAVLDLVARGKVRPWVESFPLLLAQRALGRVLDGRARYRVVVTP
ncbi:MAG: DUF692 family protein [Polyangiaceae bacterium]